MNSKNGEDAIFANETHEFLFILFGQGYVEPRCHGDGLRRIFLMTAILLCTKHSILTHEKLKFHGIPTLHKDITVSFSTTF